MSGRDPDDWTTGPAKWAALIVLGSASLLGLGWSIVNHAPPPAPAGGGGRVFEAGGGSSAARPNAVAQGESDGLAERAHAAAPSLAPVKIDLNSAGAAELELLPRIGPTLAARIVEDREENGPFGSLDDLQRVNGIGPRTVERITPYVEVP